MFCKPPAVLGVERAAVPGRRRFLLLREGLGGAKAKKAASTVLTAACTQLSSEDVFLTDARDATALRMCSCQAFLQALPVHRIFYVAERFHSVLFRSGHVLFATNN